MNRLGTHHIAGGVVCIVCLLASCQRTIEEDTAERAAEYSPPSADATPSQRETPVEFPSLRAHDRAAPPSAHRAASQIESDLKSNGVLLRPIGTNTVGAMSASVAHEKSKIMTVTSKAEKNKRNKVRDSAGEMVGTSGLIATDLLILSHLKIQLADPDYEVRKAAVSRFLEVGRLRPLQKKEVKLLLSPFKSDLDWRIKVRITAVLPLAAEKTQVIAPLLDALRVRDDEACGGGNLQLYSCRALASIGDPKVLPEMQKWVAFLESNPKHFYWHTEDLVEMSQYHIDKLETKMNDNGVQ